MAGSLGAGKTVMVHQMIAGLIEGGVSPQAIFYCNMTVPIYTAADITALFEMFCRRYHHDETAEIYVFYDEIQYVSDWRDVVMRLAELRPRARIVATMSSAAPALVTGAVSDDGNVATVVLPPLTFHEFLRFRSSEMSSRFSSSTHSEISGYLETLLRSQAGDKSITIHAWALPTLNAEFQRYVNFGGFIEGILGRKEEAAAFTRSAPGGVADRIMH
ncbi:MAG: AAA family ATPase, partial [Rhodospirillales bacterium]